MVQDLNSHSPQLHLNEMQQPQALVWEATYKSSPLIFCTAIGDRKLLQPVTKGQFKAIVAVLWPGAIPSKFKRTLTYECLQSLR